MTVNNYFAGTYGVGSANEQDLVESNIIEMIQMAGYDFFYIPRTLFNPDDFFNEVPNSRFEAYHTLEMYIGNVTDFNGQGDLMSKFGLMVEDKIELICSRKRFYEETGVENPSEGDLIYFPLTKHLFEIDFVEDEPGQVASVGQFYSLSRLYTFVFQCTLFEYSYEDFTTGVTELDTALDSTTYTTPFEKNNVINNEANNYLDFSETNPFGETTTPDV